MPRMRLPGGASELPRATAESELIAAEAVQLAADTARKQGAQALLVHRHGHSVHEYFAAGRSGSTEVEGGELSPALLALSLGALVDAGRLEPRVAIAAIRDASRPGEAWRNPWSAAARRRFTLAPAASSAVAGPGRQHRKHDFRLACGCRWGAADAALWGVDDSQLRLDSAVVARLADWMRLADLFLQQGNYQGNRVVSPDWIRQLLARRLRGATSSSLARQAVAMGGR